MNNRIEEIRARLDAATPGIPEDVPCVFDEGCICDAKHIDFCICEYGEFDDEE